MVDYATVPTVHVFGDSAPAIARMSATATAAGVRIAAAPAPGTVPDASMLMPGAALLIELDAGTAEAALPLLDLALGEAEAGARRSVISAPEGMIDLVAARAWHEGVMHLCQAEEDERRAAIVWACERPGAQLHDSRRERDFPVLQPSADTDVPSSGPEQARTDAAWLRRAIRARRLRSHFFRADLFADPAWDMLLDLMAARLEGKQVAVSSLCIAAAVPPTTALRWIGVLAEDGLVVRVADRNDGRRVHIELAEPTARALAAWLRKTRALEVVTA